MSDHPRCILHISLNYEGYPLRLTLDSVARHPLLSRVCTIDTTSNYPIFGERGVCHAKLQNCVERRFPNPYPQLDVTLKWATGLSNVEKLVDEAKIIVENLSWLQGNVVPEFYGLFSGHIGEMMVACLVAERSRELPEVDPSELYRRKVSAVTRIHAAHVICHNLRNEHFGLGKNGTVQIIDFSHARIHLCLPEERSCDCRDYNAMVSTLGPRPQNRYEHYPRRSRN
ncbi:hypothetical protein BKA93DRAFT_897205 [Sparassis latifolia]